jgi:hypothetical protein
MLSHELHTKIEIPGIYMPILPAILKQTNKSSNCAVIVVVVVVVVVVFIVFNQIQLQVKNHWT